MNTSGSRRIKHVLYCVPYWATLFSSWSGAISIFVLSYRTQQFNGTCFRRSTLWPLDDKIFRCKALPQSKKLTRLRSKEKVSNAEVLRRAGVKQDLVLKIIHRQISFIGHVLRKGQLEEAALTGRIEGKRARGGKEVPCLGGWSARLGLDRWTSLRWEKDVRRKPWLPPTPEFWHGTLTDWLTEVQTRVLHGNAFTVSFPSLATSFLASHSVPASFCMSIYFCT